MINGVRFKVCGLTSLVDADLADACGADFLGFIQYPKSPRYLPLASFQAMSGRLPPRRKVAVSVLPSVEDLRAQRAAGFDFHQVHFPHDTPLAVIERWSAEVDRSRLWLVPKLPPTAPFDSAWLALADTVLWDTFHAAGFGGSGQTGDWGRFAELQRAHGETTWVLAGGLGPENIAAAVTASAARVVDVNSGVETSPGVKSRERLQRFVLALHEATKRSNPAY